MSVVGLRTNSGTAQQRAEETVGIVTVRRPARERQIVIHIHQARLLEAAFDGDDHHFHADLSHIRLDQFRRF
ncbi:hypothetical protein D3C81_1674950 [compost metagenome]